MEDQERTLFDSVVSEPRLANANRYLVMGVAVPGAGSGESLTAGAAAVFLKGPQDAFVLGDLFGDALRQLLGGPEAKAILLAFVAGATRALHGNPLPGQSSTKQ